MTATAALIAIAHAQEISTRVQQPPPTERQTDPGENRNDIQDQETPPTRQDGEGAIIEHPEAGDDRVTTEPDRGDQEQLAWLLRHIDDIRLTDALLIGLTALLVIFTGLLALFTLRLWRATAGLWEAAKEQSRDMKASIAVAEAANELNRENMVASRRAWISIEEVHLKHPTTFTEDGLRFAIDVMIKNHGQTPATSVEIVVESHFARTSGEVFPQAESKFKSRLRSHRIELGHMLFPHDELKEGTHWIDGIDKIKDSIRTLPSGERVIDFTVFIGVSYRIIGDKDVHITYCPHGGLNVPIGTTIPAGQLVDLPREPFLAGETD